MTRRTLHNNFSEVLMNLQAWGGEIGVIATGGDGVAVANQEVDSIVVSKLLQLSREQRQLIENAGLVIDSIDLHACELVLMPAVGE